MGLFQKHFVKTGKISIDMGKFYARVYEFRHKGDYADFYEFEEEKVKEWLDMAEVFHKELAKLF